MANTLLVNDIISKKSLAYFINNLNLGKLASRQWEGLFTASVGDTVRIRKPTYFTVSSGPALSTQAIQERNDSLTIEHQDHIDVEISTREYMLRLDKNEIDERVIKPAMIQLANKVCERLVDAGLQKIYRTVGTAGTTINSFATINAAQRELRSGAVVGPYYGVMNFKDATGLQNSLQNSFNKMLNEEISQDATIGRLANFDMFYDQNLTTHTNGALAGSPAVNGASQTGSSLITNGWTGATTIKAGDVFYISSGTGVYSVNPVSRRATGATTDDLQRFIVTADATADGGGNATLSIYPAIVTSGPYQNVTNSPDTAATLTFIGSGSASYSNNFFFSKDAFALAMPPMAMVSAPYCKVLTDKRYNISLRVVKQYDSVSDKDVFRFDVIYGAECYPEYAVRAVG